jgi:predicted GIY-YIG superfamily endonuclease
MKPVKPVVTFEEIIMAIPALKRKSTKGKTVVYSITCNGTVRYIGITNCLIRRATQHNKGISSDDRKPFYIWCRENGIESVDLEMIYEYKTRVEAKRRECLIILQDHFNEKQLINKVPNISDR